MFEEPFLITVSLKCCRKIRNGKLIQKAIYCICFHSSRYSVCLVRFLTQLFIYNNGLYQFWICISVQTEHLPNQLKQTDHFLKYIHSFILMLYIYKKIASSHPRVVSNQYERGAQKEMFCRMFMLLFPTRDCQYT